VIARGRRVAILSSVHPPFDTRIFQKQARALAAGGYDVTLVVPHTRDETVDGVKLRALPPAGSRVRRMLAAPPRVLREALRLRADVYHFHDPELIPVGLALKALGKRVIYDVHEDVPKSILGKTYLPPAAVRPLAMTSRVVEQTASRAFDLIVLARDDIEESFRGHPHTLLIRNYPSRAAFPEVARADRGDGDFLVAYSGGLTAGRGAAQMLDALARVPERCRARLVIFGKFGPASLEAEMRAHPAFAKVDYRGWLPYETLPAQLVRADAGIVCFQPEPNNVNAGPTKLFEYMACGLPVVASNFPMWREVIEGHDCGICVDPTNPGAIAAALTRLADDPARRRAMGENGRRAVLQVYNWEAEAERLLAAYDRLLAG
jgi:glycosyltransferase involved in cell wall biosynthesis